MNLYKKKGDHLIAKTITIRFMPEQSVEHTSAIDVIHVHLLCMWIFSSFSL